MSFIDLSQTFEDVTDNPNDKFPRPPCVCPYIEDVREDELPEYYWDSDIDCWVCPACGDIYFK